MTIFSLHTQLMQAAWRLRPFHVSVGEPGGSLALVLSSGIGGIPVSPTLSFFHVTPLMPLKHVLSRVRHLDVSGVLHMEPHALCLLLCLFDGLVSLKLRACALPEGGLVGIVSGLQAGQRKLETLELCEVRTPPSPPPSPSPFNQPASPTPLPFPFSKLASPSPSPGDVLAALRAAAEAGTRFHLVLRADKDEAKGGHLGQLQECARLWSEAQHAHPHVSLSLVHTQGPRCVASDEEN